MSKLRAMIGTVVVMAGVIQAGAAEKTSYATNSKVQTAAVQVESGRYENAGWWPIAMSLVPGLQLPGEQHWIAPLRLNLLVGQHLDVYGIDVGTIGSMTVREFGGLQASGLYNWIGESRGALQVAALLNRCDGTFVGVQAGLINRTEKGCGLQLGLVNYGNAYTGLQLGLVNMIESSSVPFMPIINFAF